MKIGITLTPHVVEGGTVQEAVDHLLWAAQYADQNGFDIIWSTEHHISRGSFSGCPSLILSKFASLTKRAQIGYAVAILPMHHPVRLAEEISWVDQFSDGRLIAGASPGWAAYEFDVMGIDINQRQERFEEGYEILRKALRTGRITHEGKYWSLKDVEILPGPYQPGGPRFVVATTSESGLKLAARLRASPIIGFAPSEQIPALRQVYVEAAKADGACDKETGELLELFGALRRVVIRDTDKEADEAAIEAARGFARGAKALLTNQSGQHIEGILRRLDDPDEAADPRSLYAYGGTIWGSPTTVVEKLLTLREAGLGHIVVQLHTSSRSRKSSVDTIQRFATEVLPAYHARVARSAMA